MFSHKLQIHKISLTYWNSEAEIFQYVHVTGAGATFDWMFFDNSKLI